MTTPHDWTAAEAARLRRAGHTFNGDNAWGPCAFCGELLEKHDPTHPDGCDCAKCLLERLIASCEGEVGEP